jgi:hypothetical protein
MQEAKPMAKLFFFFLLLLSTHAQAIANKPSAASGAHPSIQTVSTTEKLVDNSSFGESNGTVLGWLADMFGPLTDKQQTGLITAIALAILFKIFIPLISHAFSTFMKKRKTLKMIIMDISSRVENTSRGISQLENRIEEFSNETEEEMGIDSEGNKFSQKEPLIITLGNSHEVFNIQSDKWCIPSFAFEPTYRFYALSNDAQSISDIIATDKFKELPKEKRIKTYNVLIDRWKDISERGSSTLSYIDRNWIMQFTLSAISFLKSFFKEGIK